MNDKISVIVETFDKKGESIKLCLLKPNVRINKLCDIEYKKAWVFLLRKGIPTHKTLLKDFEKEQVWTKAQEKELNDLNIQIGIQDHLMHKFIKQDKTEDAKKAALDIVNLRNKSYELIEIINQAYTYSCEGGANEIRHEAYIAYASAYEGDFDKLYFKDYEDFKNRRDERAAVDLHVAYMQSMLTESQQYIYDLPENRFLVDVGYLTQELRRKFKKKSSDKKNKKSVVKKAKKKTLKKKE